MSGPIATPSSVPRPILNAWTRSVTRRANSSATDRCTMKRFAAVHAWPMLRNFASIAPSTALSRSASSNTTKGALPPSSIEVRSTPSRRLRQQPLPDRGRAGERQLAQPRVADDRLRHGARRRGREDVHDALRQAGVLEQLREVERRERRELGRLDDDGAAGGERRRDLAGRHREREVPRRDEEARTDRMLRHDHATGALGVRPVAALDARGLLAEPAHELAAVGDLAARLGERLAHLDRHEQGEVLLALLQQVERAPEDLGALARRRRRPRGERLDGGVERRLAVGGRGIRDLLDDRAGRRVVDLERLAALGGPPLAADEERVRHAGQQFGLAVVGHGDSLVVCGCRERMPRHPLIGGSMPILPARGNAGRCTRCTYAGRALCAMDGQRRPRAPASGDGGNGRRQQELREELGELVGGGERQDVRDVLVGAHDDDAARGAVDAAQLEDVVARDRRRRPSRSR